jgi:uncharacterized protein YndB with AHSA1/START domain
MVGYPFDNLVVVKDNSNRLVVSEEAAMPERAQEPTEVRREVEVEASPEEVFEALVTEEGRERWLDEPERQIHIESSDPPNRLVWWWSSQEQPATRVDFRIVELPRGTRVVVTESVPSFPLAAMAASFLLVPA